MPEFVEPELARLVDAPPLGGGWVHEAKFDGYRMQLRVEAGRAVLRTRKGLDWSARFPEIVAEGTKLPHGMLDGEICAIKDGLPDFAALQRALSDGKTEGLVYFVFDLLFLNGRDFRNEKLSRRKQALEQLLTSKPLAHYRYVDHFAVEGETMLESACKSGLEGIVSKRIDAPYRSGRSDLWTKEKCRGGQEIVIGGWWGGPSKLRSLLVGAWRGDDFIYMGRIGTGFNSENSGPLLKALNRIKRAKSPFTAGEKPPRAKEITWVEPKLVAEVEYANLTSGGIVRQGSFKALREDKPARSVVIEAPKPVTEVETETEEKMPTKTLAKTPARPSTKTGGQNVVAAITITHPEKVLWPQAKEASSVTKLELARYYEMAAPRMLPHLALRPLSMVRAPDGIGGQQFYQRHVLAGVTGAVPMRVEGENAPYHAIDSLEGLVALGQAAVLEIHPWGCKKGDPETPERLTFDLDPAPELPFERVIDAAHEMRGLLSACGFTPFVKTTGGKGLHVVVAIKGTAKKPVTWAEAKEFAKEVAERATSVAPQRYTANMSKKQRVGKIFIDYLRNDRTATAVGPWSPRARPGATVAVPLSWRDLKKGLDPKEFSIATATAIFKRSDPWKDLGASGAPLEAARKKLDAL
jgi:bifunctional non-homologous end joining protein LigD